MSGTHVVLVQSCGGPRRRIGRGWTCFVTPSWIEVFDSLRYRPPIPETDAKSHRGSVRRALKDCSLPRSHLIPHVFFLFVFCWPVRPQDVTKNFADAAWAKWPGKQMVIHPHSVHKDRDVELLSPTSMPTSLLGCYALHVVCCHRASILVYQATVHAGLFFGSEQLQDLPLP